MKQRILLSDRTELQKTCHMVPFKKEILPWFLSKKEIYNTSHIRHIIISCTTKKYKHTASSKWGEIHLELMEYSIPIYPIAYKWAARARGPSQETTTPQKHPASVQENHSYQIRKLVNIAPHCLCHHWVNATLTVES